MLTNTSILLHAPILVLSVVGTLFSAIAVSKLRTMEPMTKKAAKVSSTAEFQLHRTRTTQGSGLIAMVLSVGSVMYLMFAQEASRALWVVSLLNLAVTGWAFVHVDAFWQNSARVPGAREYNDAVRATERIVVFLKAMIVLWGLESVYHLFFA